MHDEATQEYDDDLIAVLESVWGRGFMSPGGTAEVDRFLEGLDLHGARVLDIGCGLGGVDVHVATAQPGSSVVGIDIESHLIERCKGLAESAGVSASTEFLRVDPGPFPFDDGRFDFVISKDSIIHIADKAALAADVYRVLANGGWFAASDWLAGYTGEPSDEMKAYVAAEGLDFGLANADTYQRALRDAGFVDIEVVDRNAWYRDEARVERDALRGQLYAGLESTVGREFLTHQIEVWDTMIVALDQGELRPTHLRARKPAAA